MKCWHIVIKLISEERSEHSPSILEFSLTPASLNSPAALINVRTAVVAVVVEIGFVMKCRHIVIELISEERSEHS